MGILLPIVRRGSGTGVWALGIGASPVAVATGSVVVALPLVALPGVELPGVELPAPYGRSKRLSTGLGVVADVVIPPRPRSTQSRGGGVAAKPSSVACCTTMLIRLSIRPASSP